MTGMCPRHSHPYRKGSLPADLVPTRRLSKDEQRDWLDAIHMLFIHCWLRVECRWIAAALIACLHDDGTLNVSAECLARIATEKAAEHARKAGLPEPEPIPEWLARSCLAQLESVGALRRHGRRVAVPWPAAGKGAQRWEQAANGYELLMPPPRGYKPRRRRAEAKESRGSDCADSFGSEQPDSIDSLSSIIAEPPSLHPPIADWPLYLALCGQAIAVVMERNEALAKIELSLPPIAQEGRAGPH